MIKNNIRLARFLALSGIASRRKSEELIFQGKIRVNGHIVKDPAFKVNKSDDIEFKGSKLKLEEKLTIALNKPVGFLSTSKDDFNRKTVLDLLSLPVQARLYPAGRLDYNSRGLIVLTNDGDLAYRITHPKFGIEKVYQVKLNKPLRQDDLLKIYQGLEVEGKEVEVREVKILESGEKNSLIEIKIIEGRKRIIRKVFQKMHYTVLDLQRIQIGKFRLGKLEEGKYKILNLKEIDSLVYAC